MYPHLNLKNILKIINNKNNYNNNIINRNNNNNNKCIFRKYQNKLENLINKMKYLIDFNNYNKKDNMKVLYQ